MEQPVVVTLFVHGHAAVVVPVEPDVGGADVGPAREARRVPAAVGEVQNKVAVRAEGVALLLSGGLRLAHEGSRVGIAAGRRRGDGYPRRDVAGLRPRPMLGLAITR